MAPSTIKTSQAEIGIFPGSAEMCSALEATWPAAETMQIENVTLRKGLGGGLRVSAATVAGSVSAGILDLADEVMRGWGQSPTYMLRDDGDGDLGSVLEARGFEPAALTLGLAAPAGAIEGTVPAGLNIATLDQPGEGAAELWRSGGIHAPRLAVMARAVVPSACLLAINNGRPAGVTFVSCFKGLAMMHALEVSRSSRRQGIGRALTSAASGWAVRQECAHLGLFVTEQNAAARALYNPMGFWPVTRYQYRIKQENPL